ncbi:hypothetical protein WR25_16742 isoform C [Diploscapter pachys]|uniref:Major facilitator superfamily (MFS) profile domain-containing protein n=1 Tax=Diploscapter pachys TaxID=2018661 RepID=A0A2A2JKQ8_9BILA|nr:hypothetical protein WR25_16742 isoform C [Diploscapter pachys]
MPFLSDNMLKSKIPGYFQTLFGFVQMIGGPLFGYAIQKFGIRWALHLCYFSTVLSGVSLYYSYNFTSLMLSRLPCLFMHGQQSHQTMLSALTQPGKERTVAFGRMGLTFGIGFLFAPATSILVTKLFHDTAPILFSAFLSIVPAIVLELYIDRKSYEGHENSPDTEQKNVVMNITNTVRILSKPGVVNVLLKKNFPVAPMLLTFSFMHVYFIEKFNATPTDSQIIQMITGIFIMFSNGFGVIWLRKKFEEQTLLIIGSACFIIAFILFFFLNYLYFILVIMPFCALGMSIVGTVADSLLTALVEESEQGLVLGIATGINSFVRTFAPAFAGVAVVHYGFPFLSLIGAVSSVIGLLLCLLWPIDSHLLKKAKHE